MHRKINQRGDSRRDYERNYLNFKFQGTNFFSFGLTVLIQRYGVCTMVRMMTMILIILTVYVTEQNVRIGEISYYCLI
jgi:hypothetical protein